MRIAGKNVEQAFEDLCLRDDYFKRSSNKNLDVSKFNNIAAITARKIYSMFNMLFAQINMDVEDVESVSMIYAYHYCNLYSIVYNQEAQEKFIKNYMVKSGHAPTGAELERLDKNHLIGFLRQKLKRLAYLCKNKAKNVLGDGFQCKFFAYTANSKNVDRMLIWDNYKKYGYRPVSKNEIKGMQKLSQKCIVDANGYEVFPVCKNIMGGWRSDEYENLVRHVYENKSFEDVEEIIIQYEEDKQMEVYSRLFQDMNNEDKIMVLNNFIFENKNDKKYKKEISDAKKMINRLKMMV